MHEVIAGVRDKLGPAPRSFGFSEWLGLRAWAPWWVWLADDPLKEVYKRQRTLMREGRVVWGHIVQANELLFESGNGDCPAAALYSPDPALDGQLELLREIAHGLFDLKHTQPSDPELSVFARTLTDEMERLMKVRVPPKLTSGYEVYYTTIMVPRKHVPERKLALPFFPLLIAPQATEATMILPWRYWSTELVDQWLMVPWEA